MRWITMGIGQGAGATYGEIGTACGPQLDPALCPLSVTALSLNGVQMPQRIILAM